MHVPQDLMWRKILKTFWFWTSPESQFSCHILTYARRPVNVQYKPHMREAAHAQGASALALGRDHSQPRGTARGSCRAELSTVPRLTDTDPVETLTVVGPRTQPRWPGRHRRGTKDHGTNQTPVSTTTTIQPCIQRPPNQKVVVSFSSDLARAVVPSRAWVYVYPCLIVIFYHIQRDPENQVEVNPPVFYSRRDHVFMSTPPPALTWCFSSSHHTL